LAIFAPLREFYVSRKVAKSAKQQWELPEIGCGYTAPGSSADFMVLKILPEKQAFTGLYYEGESHSLSTSCY
jgi:hypothetical protein